MSNKFNLDSCQRPSFQRLKKVTFAPSSSLPSLNFFLKKPESITQLQVVYTSLLIETITPTCPLNLVYVKKF